MLSKLTYTFISQHSLFIIDLLLLTAEPRGSAKVELASCVPETPLESEDQVLALIRGRLYLVAEF